MAEFFHNADKVALNLSSELGCVVNNDINLSAMQHLLLYFHFKLGNLGFQHLNGF
jgi:hypothetical protein